ncbi:MAG: lamin tail domain-containing protein, partial [Pirellulaceae bacterium]
GPSGQYGGKLANGGERITLLDAGGATLHDFTYGVGGEWPDRAAGRGSTFEVIDTLGDYSDPRNWRNSNAFGGSPFGEDPSSGGPIVVNEIVARLAGGGEDQLELANTTDDPIDVGQWYVSDSSDDYFKFQFPPKTTVPASGYETFTETELGFGFDRFDGGTVWLIEASESGRPVRFVDRVEYRGSDEGIALGRWPNSEPTATLFPMTRPTFGAANSGPATGEVIFSEVYYHPPDSGRFAEDLEFVELFGPSELSVDLAGWKLVGEIELEFTEGTTVAPGASLVVVGFNPVDTVRANALRDILGMDESAQLVGPYSGSLSDDGGVVELIKPLQAGDASKGSALVDRIVYQKGAPWPSGADGGGAALHRIAVDAFGSFSNSFRPLPPSPGRERFVLPGDLDLNGQIDANDIEGLVLALTDRAAYETAFEVSAVLGGDLDLDGDLDFDDIDDLVMALQDSANVRSLSGEDGAASSTHRRRRHDVVEAVMADWDAAFRPVRIEPNVDA